MELEGKDNDATRETPDEGKMDGSEVPGKRDRTDKKPKRLKKDAPRMRHAPLTNLKK